MGATDNVIFFDIKIDVISNVETHTYKYLTALGVYQVDLVLNRKFV